MKKFIRVRYTGEPTRLGSYGQLDEGTEVSLAWNDWQSIKGTSAEDEFEKIEGHDDYRGKLTKADADAQAEAKRRELAVVDEEPVGDEEPEGEENEETESSDDSEPQGEDERNSINDTEAYQPDEKRAATETETEEENELAEAEAEASEKDSDAAAEEEAEEEAEEVEIESYQELSMAELRDEIDSRKLDRKGLRTKDSLVAVLDKDDEANSE